MTKAVHLEPLRDEGSAVIGTTGIHFVVKFVGSDVAEGPGFKVVSARRESRHSILREFELLLDRRNDMKNGVAKFSILFGDGVEIVSSCHFFEDVVLKEKAQIACFGRYVRREIVFAQIHLACSMIE
jgi:hypothetical protein